MQNVDPVRGCMFQWVMWLMAGVPLLEDAGIKALSEGWTSLSADGWQLARYFDIAENHLLQG